MEEIQVTTLEDTYPQRLEVYIIQGWPQKSEVEESINHYWPIRHEFTLIDGLPNTIFITDRSSCAVIILALKRQELNDEVSVLGEYECRHWKHYKAVCHMPGISADTATEEDNLI